MNVLFVGKEKLEMQLYAEQLKTYVPIADFFLFDDHAGVLEFFSENTAEVIFLELKKGEHGQDCIELVKKIQVCQPFINIVFVADTTDYYREAFELRISDYMLKPVSMEKVMHAIRSFRYPVTIQVPVDRLYVQCFGTFEVFWQGKPFTKLKNKTKELFAYLVDKVGAMSSSSDISFTLWEDQSDVNLRLVRKDLIETFKSIGMEDIIIKSWGKLGVARDGFFCDYYEYIKHNPAIMNMYKGKYMEQYIWADFTAEKLNKNQ